MNSIKSPLVSRAMAYAEAAHGKDGQVNKYTGEPYVNHVIEVMQIVSSVPHTDEMLAAALLHDTIEDTSVTREDIDREFGATIAELVMELTDQCHTGNRAERKKAESRRLGTVSREAQTIKLADLISNSRSIVRYDPGYAKVFLREKAQVLAAMVSGDASLYALAVSLTEGAEI